ncbi:MAG: heme exporter protein CcmD [Burkholderiales bacterium]
MVWNSWSDFVAMGGYGLYVWGSFGVTAAVLAAEIWSVAARRRVLSQRMHDAATAELGDAR